MYQGQQYRKVRNPWYKLYRGKRPWGNGAGTKYRLNVIRELLCRGSGKNTTTNHDSHFGNVESALGDTSTREKDNYT